MTLQHALHTESLEARFGPIHISIVHQKDGFRLAHLVDGEDISRTYAMTVFHPTNWTDDVRRVHELIKEGESIGRTFRDQEYAIFKEGLLPGRVELSVDLQRRFMTDQSHALFCSYEFHVQRNSNPKVLYATIFEIYSPEFRTIFE